MSNLSQAERDKLPASSFCDPKNRLYPILDQDDVTSAGKLIGKASNPDAVKRCIMGKAKSNGWKIPKAWQSGTKMSQFALETSGRTERDGFAIYPNAKIFQAGSVKDRNGKDFSMSPEELAGVVKDFSEPVGGNIEHSAFLAGKACEVRKLFVEPDNQYSLRGEVAVPLWLDQNLGDHERKVSAEFNVETKELIGLALCVNPIIPDAALCSYAVKAGTEEAKEAIVDFANAALEFAKSAHKTRTGQNALQSLHDSAARYGAICSPTSGAKMSFEDWNKKRTDFASKGENQALQTVHDTLANAGAKCETDDAGRISYPMYSEEIQAAAAEFAQSGDVEAFLNKLGGGGDPEDKTEPQSQSGKGKPKVETAKNTPWAALKSLFSSKQLKVEGNKITLGDTTVESAELAQALADDPEKAALRVEVANERKARIASEAANFAEVAIRDRRILPAERAVIVAEYSNRAEDDLEHPKVVKFAVGSEVKTGSRIDQFKASVMARAQHHLVTERVEGGVVLMSDEGVKPDSGKMTDERRSQLLNLSSLGTAVASKKKAS